MQFWTTVSKNWPTRILRIANCGISDIRVESGPWRVTRILTTWMWPGGGRKVSRWREQREQRQEKGKGRSFRNRSAWLACEDASRVRLFATPGTVDHQIPPSVESSRQEYWSGLPFPSPGGLPNLGIEPRSPALQADALPSEPPRKPIPYKTCM